MARNIFGSTLVASQGNMYHYYLPRGVINLQITYTNGSFEVEMATPSVDLIPDPDQNYFLKYSPNAFTNDHIQVEFSPQGFLKKVKTSIEDQTGEFITKVADLGTAIAQIAVAPMGTRSLETQLIHTGPLDPFDKEEVGALLEKMKQVDKDAVFAIKEIGKGNPKQGEDRHDEDTGFGIYYRPMSTFALNLSSKNSVSRTLLRLPHPEKVHFISIPIAAWVKTDFEILFEEGGYPSSIQISKPSSALAIIQVPINIVSAILKLPGELFRFRIDLSTAKQEALQKESLLREQRFEMERRQNLLESESENMGHGSRGIFDWSFFKRKDKNSSQAPAQAGSGTSGNIPSDLDDQLKKIKQDLTVMRRRINSLDK